MSVRVNFSTFDRLDATILKMSKAVQQARSSGVPLDVNSIEDDVILLSRQHAGFKKQLKTLDVNLMLTDLLEDPDVLACILEDNPDLKQRLEKLLLKEGLENG